MFACIGKNRDPVTSEELCI